MERDERSLIGKPVRRVEDPRLVTGGGRYLDDLRLEGTLRAVFVRSPEAHARIIGIDVAEAAAMPGVVGVFAAAELGLDRTMPTLYPSPLVTRSVQAHPLAVDEVCHVGEPVAVVVAEDAYLAVDAAAAVHVDYESLPAVVDYRTALDERSPAAHDGAGDNLLCTVHRAYGDVGPAFADADHIVRIAFTQHRGACVSMETRGVLAHDDPVTGELVVWSSTQSPHLLRQMLAGYFEVAPEHLRVVAPDVGGGFGPKAGVYAEEYVITALARTLGRPVKWVESRREHFTTTLQQRDQAYDLEVACSADGGLLGMRGSVLHDNGAYLPYGILLALTGLDLMPGPYVLPSMEIRIDMVYTNLVPTSPIRGAGRPYAVFAMERVIDAVARATGLDPAEVRRRNFVPADAFPYELPFTWRTGQTVSYDSGDYRAALEAALELSDHAGFESRRAAARERGVLRGIGVASYVEDTGLGPIEGARVEVMADGRVVVDTGVGSQGQGHATVLAQLVAGELGLDVEDVTVRAGDTAVYREGAPTVASRTAMATGSSVHLAAVEVADIARRRAAQRLEAAEADLVLADGMVRVVGQPGAAVPLSDLVEDGLMAEGSFRYSGPAFAYGSHVAEVEVDPETGHVAVVGYAVAHDCGRVINPMIVDGQIDGGVAHGLGNALLERVAFSDDGQPLATTFMDYRIMTAMEMPPLVKVHSETPSPFNPLGVKGAGEGGTLPAAAAVASAVENALAEYGVVVDRHPLDPGSVRRMIEDASAG